MRLKTVTQEMVVPKAQDVIYRIRMIEEQQHRLFSERGWIMNINHTRRGNMRAWHQFLSVVLLVVLVLSLAPAPFSTARRVISPASAKADAHPDAALDPTPSPAVLPTATTPVAAPSTYDLLHNGTPSAIWSRFTRHGVNVVLGNFVAQSVDLQVVGRGLSFAFVRTYNSADPADGPLGRGWTHSYNLSLTVESATSVLVRGADGRLDRYTLSSGQYTPPPGVFNTLTANSDGTFSLKQLDQTRYHFDAAGRLSTIVDRNNNTLALSYEAGRLARITDTIGRVFAFSYDGAGHLIQLADPSTPPRTIAFTYDEAGHVATSTDVRGKTTAFTYDGAHRLTTITDPRPQRVLSNTYDNSGRVIQQQDAAGKTVTFAYDYTLGQTRYENERQHPTVFSFDAQYRVTGEQDARNSVAAYTYDARHNLVSFVDQRGYRSSFTYDAAGNLLMRVDPLGSTTTMTYDALNNPLTVTDARSKITTMRYDTRGNLVAVVDALNQTTSLSYDALGQLQLITDAEGRITDPTYDAQGNLTSIKNAFNHITRMTPDAVGRVTGVTDARSYSYSLSYDSGDNPLELVDPKTGRTTFTYDAVGNRLTATDANTRTTQFTYDERNLQTAVIDPAGKRTQYAYTATGQVATVTDANNATTTSFYDERDWLVKVQAPDGGTSLYEYDPNHNLIKVTDAANQATQYTYDALNRVTKIATPVGTTRYEYDVVGNRTAVIDANGSITRYGYDALNRLERTTDALGKITRYEYDAVGNQTAVIDPKNHAIRYTYDDLNRLTAISDGLNHITRYTYDAVGNRTEITDPNANVTQYRYDELNRVKEIVYPDQTIAFTYDAVGNRATMVDRSGTTTYTYDPLNRLKTITNGAGQSLSYGYDAIGNRTSLTYPSGKVVTSTYDGLRRLTSVVDGAATTRYSYDKRGNRTGVVFPNGVTTAYTYDEASRLEAIRTTSTISGTLLHVDYVLDNVGNRVQMVDNEGLTNYSYDQLHRLTGVTYPDNAEVNYSYDDAGNRKTMVGPEGTTTYTYDAADRLTSMTLGSTATAFSYDNNGNMTAKGATQYTYDSANRLTKVISGTTTVEYNYDGEGYRTSRSVNGTVHKYTWDTQAALPEMVAETIGTESTEYLYGGDLLAQTAPNDLDFYYHADGLGSVRAISGADGSTANRYSYDAFGQPRVQEGVFRNPYQFTGQQVDAETGLVYLRARYYDPSIGRFLSRDPVLTEPPYAYVRNNPVMLVDRDGQFAVLPIIAGAAIGAVVSGATYALTTKDFNLAHFGATAAGGAVAGAAVPFVWAAAGAGLLTVGAGGTAGAATAVSMEVGAFVGLNTYLAKQAISGEEVSGSEAMFEAVMGGLSSYIGGGSRPAIYSLQTLKSNPGLVSHLLGKQLFSDARNAVQIEAIRDLRWPLTDPNEVSAPGLDSGFAAPSKASVIVNPTPRGAKSSISGQKKQPTQPGPVIPKGNSPRRPTPSSPSDWYLERRGGQVQLCAQHNGSPDANITIPYYQFKAGGAGWPGYWFSQVLTSNCATTNGLSSGSYPWQVRVADNRGYWSDWSDIKYFTIGSTALTLDDLRFSGGSNSDLVRVYTCARSDVLGTNLKMWANTATDGSADGEWQWIDVQGRVCMDTNDTNTWARWDTLDLADGTHRVRAIAYRGTVENDTYVEAVKEVTFTLSRRRPSTTRALTPIPNPVGIPIVAPGEGQWFNTRTITFTWSPVLDQRITSYQLSISTSTDPRANPLVTRTFDASARQFVHTFAADHTLLSWEIRACNELGCGHGGSGPLGIDRAAPVATVNALPATTYELNVPVRWSGTDNAAGIVAYDIQYKDGANGVWRFWKVNQTDTTGTFNGEDGHTYYFRARARDRAGNESTLTDSDGDTSIRVDSSTRPIEPWWNAAYSAKRNLLMVNRDSTRALPTAYPMLLRFDTTTTPSAATIYAASLSPVKGNDIRIVYNNQTELNRFIPVFSSDRIDIWFKLEAPLNSLASDGTSYQLYSGNSAATNPPGDVAGVMPPAKDTNTLALWHLHEGQGGTATDSVSGRVATALSNGGGHFSWEDSAFFGSAVVLSGQPQDGKGVWLDADGNGLSPSQISVEAWVRETSQGVERTLVSRQSNGGSGWQLFLFDGTVAFEVNYQRVSGGPNLTPGVWYHVVGTYDGATLRVYLNGQKVGEKTVNTSVPTGGGALRIGKHSDSTNYFNGAIQHVRISNVARSTFSEASFTLITPTPQVSAGDTVARPSPTPTPTATRTPSPTAVPPTSTPTATPTSPPTGQTIYADALTTGWENWSWGTAVDLAVTSPVQTGSSAISVGYNQAWAGFYLHHAQFIPATGSILEFAIHGGSTGGQTIKLFAKNASGGDLPSVALNQYVTGGGVAANAWRMVRVPMADLGVGTSAITGIVLQDATGGSQSAFYLDNLRLVNATPPPTSTPTPTPTPPPAGGSTIYDDDLAAGWENWSWDSTVDFALSNPVQTGSHAISVRYTQAWAGLYLHHAGLVPTNNTFLEVAIHGGTTGGQNIQVQAKNSSGVDQPAVPLNNYVVGGSVAPNAWRTARIPLTDLGIGSYDLTGIIFQDAAGGGQPVFYLDNLRLVWGSTYLNSNGSGSN